MESASSPGPCSAPASLPIWEPGEDDWIEAWHLGDLDDDLAEDLSIRENIGLETFRDWRLWRQ